MTTVSPDRHLLAAAAAAAAAATPASSGGHTAYLDRDTDTLTEIRKNGQKEFQL